MKRNNSDQLSHSSLSLTVSATELVMREEQAAATEREQPLVQEAGEMETL